MIKISNIHIKLDYDFSQLNAKCAKILGISPDLITNISIFRLSIDARRKSDVFYVCTVILSTKNEKSLVDRLKNKNICLYTAETYEQPIFKKRIIIHPIVVGTGPAGLFCALTLARSGLKPILIERGFGVHERTKDVEKFFSGGELNIRSNVQFGEGGAGTFSDGKLTTGINDSRISHVFETFVQFGADKDIIYSNKPHIGTDVLREVVLSMRSELIKLGVDIRFGTKLIDFKERNGEISEVTLEGETGQYSLPCSHLVLALGHSARDTFRMLYSHGVNMESKAFAVGVRIEQLQRKISQSQFGDFHKELPPSDYKLACHLPNGRSAFSFCVCPGGQVVAATSEEGRLVTNGMSYRARDLKNINGGLLIGVRPDDFQGNSPLAGMEFQEHWESVAFKVGGSNYHAPMQTVGNFLDSSIKNEVADVIPSYAPGVTPCDLRACLPSFITQTLEGAIPKMDRSLHGFGDKSSILTGIETRSSSPVRILRDEMGQSNIRGIYPCGEGAGYAGGITSAAVDGIKIAEKIILD